MVCWQLYPSEFIQRQALTLVHLLDAYPPARQTGILVSMLSIRVSLRQMDVLAPPARTTARPCRVRRHVAFVDIVAYARAA